MEQQVNLYQPILGAQQHLFSARAIGAALALLAVSLLGLSGFAHWRSVRIEAALISLERRQAAELALSERGAAAIRPAASVAELDEIAKHLSADITARERTFEIVRHGSSATASGFASRLEALARSQLNGLWLHRIIVASGDGQLALQGSATDARLIPEYLSALAAEPALDGAQFDRLELRQARIEEAPAITVFNAGAPGLAFAAEEKTP